MNMTKKEEREFRRYRLPLPMRFTSGLMAWVFFTVSIMPSHIVIAAPQSYNTETIPVKVSNTPKPIRSTLAQSGNKLDKALAKAQRPQESSEYNFNYNQSSLRDLCVFARVTLF